MSKVNIWVVIIIFLVVLGGVYELTSRSWVESTSTSPTPTPTPSELIFNITPTPSAAQAKVEATGSAKPVTQSVQSGGQLPLSKNKYVGHFPGVLRAEVLANKKAVITTAKGKIEIEVYPEAPKAASNFILLAINGFYDGLTFHRVEDWVAQGGDPLGNGSGGAGYKFEDEPVIRAYTKGVVAYANAGPSTNSSQFFILKADQPNLPPNYTIFGKVIEGDGVVDKITAGDVMEKVTIEQLR